MISLSSFPAWYWPVIATPVTPEKIGIRFVHYQGEAVPRTTKALIVEYKSPTREQGKPVDWTKQDLRTLRMAELFKALGYEKIPVGKIEGVSQVLSSQLCPTAEYIQQHSIDPKPCNHEEHQELWKVFFGRQFCEQSVQEVNLWRRNADEKTRARGKTAFTDGQKDTQKAYETMVPMYYDRANAALVTVRPLIPKLWDKLVAHFEPFCYQAEVPFVGLRIKSLDKLLPGEIKEW